MFDLPFVWFNPKILFVVFATISRSHKINRILNCNQYVNIDMTPLINIVVSMMTLNIYFYIWFYFFFSCFRPPKDLPIYSSIVANHILSFPLALLSSLSYSSSSVSLLVSHNIFVIKILIINLYHIIIPLTAAHKKWISATVFPFSCFLLFLFAFCTGVEEWEGSACARSAMTKVNFNRETQNPNWKCVKLRDGKKKKIHLVDCRAKFFHESFSLSSFVFLSRSLGSRSDETWNMSWK